MGPSDAASSRQVQVCNQRSKRGCGLGKEWFGVVSVWSKLLCAVIHLGLRATAHL